MPDTQELTHSQLHAFADEANVFQEQVLGESDRGAALIGYAYLEELLKRLFESKMLDRSLAEKLLNHSGALATSSAQADLA